MPSPASCQVGDPERPGLLARERDRVVNLDRRRLPEPDQRRLIGRYPSVKPVPECAGFPGGPMIGVGPFFLEIRRFAVEPAAKSILRGYAFGRIGRLAPSAKLSL